MSVTIGDLQDPQTPARLIEDTVAALGSIDILVNNAGMIRRSPAAEYSIADWTSVLQTNLTSVFQLCQSAATHMLRQKSGKIVNIASLLTFQGGILVPAYAAAKGAVGQLTKALANEWSASGINVNAIAPGYMATDNTQALRNDPVRSRQILERIPAGRWVCPRTSPAPSSFSPLLPATMFTAMFSPSTEAGSPGDTMSRAV